MKKHLFLSLMLLVLTFAANCFAESFTNDGMTLNIPDEYVDLLVVETPEEGRYLFSVSELESIETGREQGYEVDGIGWLFGIGCVSEEEAQQLRCNDMSGMEIFAKDQEDNYYIFYHPTDVRVVRAEYNEETMAGWKELNQWAYSMKQSFISDNNGLTPESYGNTMLDIYLARVLYADDVNYIVSSLEYGPQQPNGINAADYLEPLTKGVVYEWTDEEAPDGEYVVLNFPDEDLRFDFFFQAGKENYVRQVWYHDQNEALYKAVFEDESLKATDIMNDFYHDIVLKNSLGYTADDLVGVWAEKIAGRGSIEITKAAEEGQYDILINWGSSAWQTAVWQMTAVATGNGPEIRYENGKHSILTWESEEKNSEEIVYENGTGTFNLLSTYELLWNDETGNAADDTVFIKAN